MARSRITVVEDEEDGDIEDDEGSEEDEEDEEDGEDAVFEGLDMDEEDSDEDEDEDDEEDEDEDEEDEDEEDEDDDGLDDDTLGVIEEEISGATGGLNVKALGEILGMDAPELAPYLKVLMENRTIIGAGKGLTRIYLPAQVVKRVK